MAKSVISEGKTKQEAIEKGLKAINLPKELCEIKVLNDNKKSFFDILAPTIVKVEIKEIEAKKPEKMEINATEEELNVSRNTVTDYLDVLNKLHLIENQNSFMYNIRSRANVGKIPKRHLTDPSLGCAVLNITPEKLMNDLETFGFYFEALCERDLRIYAESLDAKLYHYRENSTGLEVDAIVEIADGEYGAIEIKLGSNQEEEAAKNLKKFYDLVDVKPKFMCIICGLYDAIVKRPDGIYIIPITALKN